MFAKNDDGDDLVFLIQKDWKIFSSDICAKTILTLVMKKANMDFSMEDKVSYIPDIQVYFKIWEQLKYEVQREKRYFSDLSSYNWCDYVKSNAIIKKGTVLYRARITPDGKKKFKPKEMGCPPKELASAGRANPLGIPYLYLCNKMETTYYEVRAVYLDRLSIGKFTVQRDLNIVDFSDKANLFYTYSESGANLSDIVKRKIIFDNIRTDLSKPLRRFDTEIEYVPTQLICEYCKLNGADGIRFESSLHQSGTNIVLFNSSDVKCYSVELREITKVTIESKE